jgi:hypothetical protein
MIETKRKNYAPTIGVCYGNHGMFVSRGSPTYCTSSAIGIQLEIIIDTYKHTIVWTLYSWRVSIRASEMRTQPQDWWLKETNKHRFGHPILGMDADNCCLIYIESMWYSESQTQHPNQNWGCMSGHYINNNVCIYI